MILTVKKTGINGEGIAYFERKPVFIEGCFIGETVKCSLDDRGRYYVGKLEKVIKKSNARIRQKCPYAGKCGGCSLIELRYENQLEVKKELLREALHKYAGYRGSIEGIGPSDKIFGYRNKCNLPVVMDDSGKLANALYRTGSNKPVFFDRCLLHEESLENIRIKIMDVLNSHGLRAYSNKEKKGIRQLVMRELDGQCQVVLITGNDRIDNEVINEISEIKGVVSLYQGINTQKNPIKLMTDRLTLLKGCESIELKLGSHVLKLDPQAFFQLNYGQAKAIYEEVDSLITDKVSRIIEAYCGIGAISLYLSDRADEIIGIDIEKKAIENAEENARMNGITNARFIAEDASSAVRKLVREKRADVLVVDPPRSGLDEKLLECLRDSDIATIIYVSCNPATLAKDLSILKKSYRIEKVKGFDMFPNTALVETVCSLYHK
ncbi:MAG: 23S rRNA (uracil(1939)-C(5))-methyltransferase RlmD [Erysipelotrichaceae bacterium]|nr:23S rRNA (uracil(1939)-C(5))-methyltransferase RlmD [Erysipelotrichaceae bacterium]